MGSIRGKAHTLPDNAHSNGQHFSGAMERYTMGWGDGTLRMGSIRGEAHRLPQTHMASVSTPLGQRNVTCVGSECKYSLTATPVMSTRTKAGQFNGQ